MKIIAIANQKGGVGKTTTSINLAHSLNIAEKSCLLIDIDPQSNATSGLGMTPDHSAGIYPVLIGQKNISQAVATTKYNELDILVSTPLLNDLEEQPGVRQIGQSRLKSELSKKLDKDYSYVLIDCPPSFGIFSLNALIAANEVVIPIQCEYYAMEGLSQMIGIIEDVKNKYNKDLKVGGILLTMHDANLEFSEEVASEVRRHFPELTYNTIIPRDVSLAESASFGQPVMVYDPVSRGTFGYAELCREILYKPIKDKEVLNEAKEAR